MQRATFYVDYCYEAGSDEYGKNLTGRYGFLIDFPDKIYEELHQVWYDNDCDLNNWDSNWDGHDTLYNTITQIATEMLNKTMEEEWPEILPISSWQVLWELSKETTDAFEALIQNI